MRKDYRSFENDPRLIERFKNICSRIFTFVNGWNDERVMPYTYRVFSKKAPAREALYQFQRQVKAKYRNNPNHLRKRRANDIKKSRYGHDWHPADDDITQQLNKKCREPEELLFEIGSVYTCTFNDQKKSNSQKAILFDLPSQEALDEFQPIKILLAPPGCKDVLYEPDEPKSFYLDQGFNEITVGCAPHKVLMLGNNVQGVRKQYGLQHYVAGTIHSIMGDTLRSLATTLSSDDRNYSVWDKGQLLVIISRTKRSEDTIFVGNKESTLNALVSILTTRTQWTEYMENILRVVTINDENGEVVNDIENYNRGVIDQSEFPFRIADIELPIDVSGYVYMLISLRTRDFVYVGKTKDLHERIRSHQSGNGSLSSQPEHLRPYAYFGYICGFNGNETMMFYVEEKWKEEIKRLRARGIHDPKQWASRGGNEVLNLNLSNFGVEDTRAELRLVLLFE